MKNIPLLLGTVIGTLVLIFVVAFFFSSSTAPTGEAVVDSSEVAGVDRPSKGNPEAPITIVEFSDFQCPACKATAPLVENVFNQYADEVRLIYRHFPLDSIHQNARAAAYAAESAKQDGKFWEMHDKLFETQEEWQSLSEAEVKEVFAGFAEELAIDKVVFLERMESDAIKDAVNADVAAATKFGIGGTPTFFVNGVQTPALDLAETIESLRSSN